LRAIITKLGAIKFTCSEGLEIGEPWKEQMCFEFKYLTGLRYFKLLILLCLHHQVANIKQWDWWLWEKLSYTLLSLILKKIKNKWASGHKVITVIFHNLFLKSSLVRYNFWFLIRGFNLQKLLKSILYLSSRSTLFKQETRDLNIFCKKVRWNKDKMVKNTFFKASI